jgi:S-adenosylmethionine:tRNA ribosyltransferase-isomerase
MRTAAGTAARTAASSPPEARGLTRDGVRLLVATTDGLVHATFGDLPRFLREGDLLVVNTSGTLAGAADGSRADGTPVTVHFSTPLDDGTWVVELRDTAFGRVRDASPGEIVRLPAGASLTLLDRYPDPAADRLWRASVPVPDVPAYLAGHGRPIRYSYVPQAWPVESYQTVFAREAGSAEMPSAGRPFTAELVTRLVTAGIIVAPVTLHAGVASLEAGEQPLPERFSVPEPTAQLVNLTRAAGRRVVAVGTTVTRALESAVEDGEPSEGLAEPGDGLVRAAGGWTDLVLGAERPARVVGGIITGWHDPEASHLALLAAVAGPALVRAAYAEAEQAGYLGHEFGDSCLMLPPLTSRAPVTNPALRTSQATQRSRPSRPRVPAAR